VLKNQDMDMDLKIKGLDNLIGLTKESTHQKK